MIGEEVLIKKISYHFTSFLVGYRYIDKLILLVWEIFFKLPLLLILPLSGDTRSFTKISKKVYNMLPNLFIKINDYIFYCRKQSLDFPYLFSTYEMNLKPVFEKIKEGVFIDVGAHVGGETIVLAKNLGKKGKVISVEPEPSNFRSLLKNIKLNELENTIPLNIACSSRNGNLKLYLSPTDEGSHSCTEKVGREYVEVKSKTIDYILHELKIKPIEVKLVKIDVEGAESLVFQGGEKLFKKGNPIVVFESLDSTSFRKCKRILSSWKYSIKRIDESNFLAYKSPRFDSLFSAMNLISI